MISPQLSKGSGNYKCESTLSPLYNSVLVLWSKVRTRIITFTHSLSSRVELDSCETIENFQANIKLHLHSELGVLLGKLSITNSLQCKLRFFDEV